MSGPKNTAGAGAAGERISVTSRSDSLVDAGSFGEWLRPLVLGTVSEETTLEENGGRREH